MVDQRGARWWAKALTPPIVVIAVKGRSVASSSCVPAGVGAARPDSVRPSCRSGSTCPRAGAARPGWDGGLSPRLPRQVARLRGGDRGRRTRSASTTRPREATARAGRRRRAQHARLVRLRRSRSRAGPRPAVAARLGRRARPLRRRSRVPCSRARARLPREARCRPSRAPARAVNPDVTFHADDSCLDRTLRPRPRHPARSSTRRTGRRCSRRSAARRPAGSYVTRLPIALDAPSFVVLQRAGAYGYETEYLGWVVNRDELLDAAFRTGLGSSASSCSTPGSRPRAPRRIRSATAASSSARATPEARRRRRAPPYNRAR